jgi:hypothetical protein
MDATVLEENYRRTPIVLGHQLVDLLRAATVPVALVVVAAQLLMAMLAAEVVVAEAPHIGLAGEPVAEAIAEAEATQTATSLVPHAVVMTPAAELKKYDARSPPRQARTSAFRLLCSTSQSTSPRKIQASGDHQVGCEARSSPMAQMLRSLHRKCWWQQRHEVPLLSLLPGPISTYMARVTREVLDRQVRPAQGTVHQQLRGCHGALGYSHGPGYGEAGIGRDPTQVYAVLFR